MNKPIALKIRSEHSNLLEAVRAAGIDLSYNERAALDTIRMLDQGSRRHNHQPVIRAYVVLRPDLKAQSYSTVDASGIVLEVWYEFDCDLKLLNKFTPFSACMHDGPFYPVNRVDDELVIATDIPLRSDRKLLAAWQVGSGPRVTKL